MAMRNDEEGEHEHSGGKKAGKLEKSRKIEEAAGMQEMQ